MSCSHDSSFMSSFIHSFIRKTSISMLANNSNSRYKDLRSHLERYPFVCKCFETLEKNDWETIIRFHCVLPRPPPPAPADTANNFETREGDESSQTTRSICISFDCQAPSCGALKLDSSDDADMSSRENASNETHVVDEWNALEDNETVDPHLFEAGYTLAGRTGFQVWAGARLLLEYCLAQVPKYRHDDDVDDDNRRPCCRIVELGAGVGLVGTAIAIHCANVQVLMTDLPTLVEHSLVPNVRRNHEAYHFRRGASNPPPPPPWLLQAAAPASLAVVSFASSWVGTANLDWTKPVAEQLKFVSFQPENNNNRVDVVPTVTAVPDLILASDCVWLVSMLDSLLDTADALMTGTHTKMWLSLQKREVEEEEDSTSSNAVADVSSSSSSILPSSSSSGPMFTTIESILRAITARSWQWTCVAWRPVRLVDGHESEAFVFEISKKEKESLEDVNG